MSTTLFGRAGWREIGVYSLIVAALHAVGWTLVLVHARHSSPNPRRSLMKSLSIIMASVCLSLAASTALAADDMKKSDAMAKDTMMRKDMTMQECKDHMAMAKKDGMKKDDAMMKMDAMCADDDRSQLSKSTRDSPELLKSGLQRLPLVSNTFGDTNKREK